MEESKEERRKRLDRERAARFRERNPEYGKEASRKRWLICETTDDIWFAGVAFLVAVSIPLAATLWLIFHFKGWVM